MNVKQLETLLWIVRRGSFAGAAAQMNATQSTVSMRIQELEQDLGVVLFDRTQRKAHLTAKGRELIPYAEEATALFIEIKRRVGSSDAVAGVARMGVAEMVAVTWLPDLISLVHDEYPNLTLELDVSLTVDLFAKLRGGDLDVALIPGGQFDPSLVAQSLGSVRFVWMASSRLELPDRTLTPQDLSQWTILSLGEGSYHHDTTKEWLAAESGRRRRVDICNSMSVIASLTAAGLGISLLPPCCYQAEIASGALRVLDTSPGMPEVEFSAVYLRRQPKAVPQLIAEAATRVTTFRQHAVQPTIGPGKERHGRRHRQARE